MPPCCAGCAPEGLGDADVAGGAGSRAMSPLTLLAASLAGLAVLVALVPEVRRRRRPPALYNDPRNDNRRTMEVPAFESMSEVVFQRKR